MTVLIPVTFPFETYLFALNMVDEAEIFIGIATGALSGSDSEPALKKINSYHHMQIQYPQDIPARL